MASAETTRFRFQYTGLEFEDATHHHPDRMTKAELAAHLTHPHKQKNGAWRAISNPVSAILKWRREEMEHTHAEFHANA